MKNTGVELNLSYDWISTRDLLFTTSISAAYNSNRIEKIDYEPTDALDMMRYPESNYRIGDTYNSLYAYKYAGLTEDGRPSVYDENGEVTSVKSVRNIGAVVCAGQLTPKWNGALNLGFPLERTESVREDSLLHRTFTAPRCPYSLRQRQPDYRRRRA